MATAYPVSEFDPFSLEFLSDPHRQHERLREAGPVVWLERYGVWAMARHEQVQAVLGDWETFCSSAGVGLSDFRKEKPWRPPSILLEADPPLHTRTRRSHPLRRAGPDVLQNHDQGRGRRGRAPG
jgi:cytochrome P450